MGKQKIFEVEGGEKKFEIKPKKRKREDHLVFFEGTRGSTKGGKGTTKTSIYFLSGGGDLKMRKDKDGEWIEVERVGGGMG